MTEIIPFISRRDQLIANVRANIAELKSESAKLVADDTTRFTFDELSEASYEYDALYALLAYYDSEEFDVLPRFAYYASLVCETREQFEILKKRARDLADSVFDFNASEGDHDDLLDE